MHRLMAHERARQTCCVDCDGPSACARRAGRLNGRRLEGVQVLRELRLDEDTAPQFERRLDLADAARDAELVRRLTGEAAEARAADEDLQDRIAAVSAWALRNGGRRTASDTPSVLDYHAAYSKVRCCDSKHVKWSCALCNCLELDRTARRSCGRRDLLPAVQTRSQCPFLLIVGAFGLHEGGAQIANAMSQNARHGNTRATVECSVASERRVLQPSSKERLPRHVQGATDPVKVVTAIAAFLDANNRGRDGLQWFLRYDAERARAAAAASAERWAAGAPRSVLDGVPFAVKDSEDCAGFPTCAGTSYLAAACAPRRTACLRFACDVVNPAWRVVAVRSGQLAILPAIATGEADINCCRCSGGPHRGALLACTSAR